MSDQFLTLSPSELRFRFELRKNVPCTMTLHNPTSGKVAFKVKTTSPKKYCVRPSSGIVEPGATKEVQVIMQAQRDAPASLADCRDKFLVQAVKVGPDAREVTPDMFDASKAKDIRQTKLRVVLVAPAKPPSPVPEGVEDSEASPGLGRAGLAAAGTAGGARLEDVARERDRLRDQLARTEREKARLDVLARGRAATAGGSGYGLLSVLLVAALAFAIGQALAARFGAVISAAGLGSGGWTSAGWGGAGGKGLGAHLDGLAKKASSAWAAAVAKK